jgi:hypothetical protein
VTSPQVIESLLDPREFARQLIGEPVWPHQAEVLLCDARTIAVCSGRQAGKSRTLAVKALHTAFTRRGSRTLIMSAGDDAAKELLADIVDLASAPLLGGSIADDNKSTVVLSNGSTIRCIPASERQARGPSVDLLVLDEAASISDELWRAVRYTIIARPDSRIIMAGTPFGSQDRFFAQTFRLGQNRAEGYASFHWPSQVSPLVDEKILEDWRRTDPEWVYRQEVLAEWVDDQQAYFSADELEQAVADYELMDADAARAFDDERRTLPAVAGIDYGLRNDANVITLVAPLDDFGLNDAVLGEGQRAYFVPWLSGRARWAWHDFAAYVADLIDAYAVEVVASEVNGVGDAATSIVRNAIDERAKHTETMRGWFYRVYVADVMIDNRRKQAGFGRIKSLLQQHRLVLPRHPELLRQLNALQFTYTDTGAVRISVPERLGHDDFCMSLLHAISCVDDRSLAQWSNPGAGFYANPGDAERCARAYRESRSVAQARVDRRELDVVHTAGGLLVPRSAVPDRSTQRWYRLPPAAEHGEAW